MSRTAKTQGFTLIEFIIVIVLFSILSGIAGLILSQHFKSYFVAKQLTHLASQTNIAVDNVMRELKGAGSLSALSTTSISFVNQSGETIVIDLNGTTLRRAVNGAAAQPLCLDVTSVVFSAYDANFTSTTSVSNARFISLQLTANTQTSSLPYTLMAGTTLRALLP